LRAPRKPMRVRELVNHINNLISRVGFKAFVEPVPPDLTAVDGFDVVWVLNRFYKALFSQLGP